MLSEISILTVFHTMTYCTISQIINHNPQIFISINKGLRLPPIKISLRRPPMSMIAMMTPITRILSLILVVSLASSGGWFLPSRVLVTAESTSTSTTSGGKGCERLQDTLTYTQEEAPRDLSSVVRNVNNTTIVLFFYIIVYR